MHGLDTHTWKLPRETSYVTHTLRTRTAYAHMQTGLNPAVISVDNNDYRLQIKEALKIKDL